MDHSADDLEFDAAAARAALAGLAEQVRRAGDEAPEAIEARLLPAVEDLLFARGYVGLNIRELAKRVGMGPATIYKYYASKEALALRVLQVQDVQVAAFVGAALPRRGVEQERWLAFYRALLLYYDANVKVAVVQNVAMPTYTWFLPEHRWPVAGVAEIVRGLIRDGRAAGALDDAITDNQILATHYMHLVREVRLWRSRGMRWRLADRVETFFPIVWKTISRLPER